MDNRNFLRFPANHDPRAQGFYQEIPICYIPPIHQTVQIYNPYYTPLQPPLLAGPPPSIQTRCVLVSMVPANISEWIVREGVEVFGDVRAVQMERVGEGIVTVHFYDIRHAESAVAEIQDQYMLQQFRLRRHYQFGAGRVAGLPPPVPTLARGLIAGQAVWAQFEKPDINRIPNGINQGTIVMFNLDPIVSAGYLKHIFREFGKIKELRYAPNRRHQRFVEFYDVRDAANAETYMNLVEINGKPVLIEFGRPARLRTRYGRRRSPLSIPPPLPPPPTTTAASAPQSQYNNTSNAHPEYNSSIENDDGLDSTNLSNTVWRKGVEVSSLSSPLKRRRIAGKQSNDGGGNENDDHSFMISEEEINESDGRTTLLIKNIPKSYREKRSMGYGFVNMTSAAAAAAWRLYKAFHLQPWQSSHSSKLSEVTYARIQGIEALKENFTIKNIRIWFKTEDYQPVMFSPPRDGRMLTVPVPIFPKTSVGF